MPRLSLTSWLRRRLRPTQPIRRHARLAFRPHLEILEDRLAPAQFTVTNLTDDPINTGSLRYAVNQANTNGQDNTIQFAVGGTIVLGSQLELSSSGHNVTIDGAGQDVTLNGKGLTRVFQVDAGVTAVLTGLTIANGSAYDDSRP